MLDRVDVALLEQHRLPVRVDQERAEGVVALRHRGARDSAGAVQVLKGLFGGHDETRVGRGHGTTTLQFEAAGHAAGVGCLKVAEKKAAYESWGCCRPKAELCEVLREGLRLIEERERIREAKLKSLKQAARQGWADVSAGRYADVADDQLEDFVGQLGRRAIPLAKTAS